MRARKTYFTISSPLAVHGQYSMPGPLISKNVENDKITKYDDTPIGVDSKKGDSSPVMQFFYTFSKVKKNKKYFIFLFTCLTYVGYTILTNVRGDYYGKEKVTGDEPCGNRNPKISLAA